MDKIIDYCIVTADEWFNEDELMRLVKHKMSEGWQPAGGMYIIQAGGRFVDHCPCQAMVKYEQKPTDTIETKA